jgi:predicted DNA-binding transcriptional regulator AlpA
MIPKDTLLNLQEVADRLGVSRQRIYQLMERSEAGMVPIFPGCQIIGGRRVWWASDVDKWQADRMWPKGTTQ